MGLETMQWQFRSKDLEELEEIARKLGLPRPIVSILHSRGLVSPEAIQDFFSPTLAKLPSPSLMKGIGQSVLLIIQAIEQQRKIIIYGDYDVDGTTGTAILELFLRKIGFEHVCSVQPHRLNHGYGLHLEALCNQVDREILDAKPLLITVDCGITENEVIVELNSMGMEVIITDHHRTQEMLPPAAAIVNPLQPGCDFPFKGLAGVGVAFYLIIGLRKELIDRGIISKEKAPNLKEFLDLVALGTVADMVPMLGVNRILVTAGLEVMNSGKRPGLNSLIGVSGCNIGHVTEKDLGFRLGPRVNAAGRMGSPKAALELFLCQDQADAENFAQELDSINEKRKLLGEEIFTEACILAEEKIQKGDKGLVVSGRDWHFGVLGIVASRLANKYSRPVILLSSDGITAKGSGRSVDGINLFTIVDDHCRSLLNTFGGHSGAIGLSLAEEKVATLDRTLQDAFGDAFGFGDIAPKFCIDLRDEDSNVFTKRFLSMYERLAPFGVGNPEPIFSAKGVVQQSRVVGLNHLKFSFKSNGSIYEAIGFGMKEKQKEIESEEVEVAFHLSKNHFRGRTSWQLQVEGTRPTTT